MHIEMRNSIKAVFFDLDDTLYDRSLAQSEVLKLIVKRLLQIFKDYDMERVAEAFAESDRLIVADFQAGAPSDGLREARSRLFLRLLGIQEDYADVITEIYVTEYPAMYAPVAGAIPLVKKLSLKLPVGVVSNGLPDVQYRKLESIGLRNVFSCIVLSEEIGIRKPDPNIFLHAARLLRVEPQECLFVGDSYTDDVIGAKTAGMIACWLKRELSLHADKQVKPDLVISCMDELAEILRKGERV